MADVPAAAAALLAPSADELAGLLVFACFLTLALRSSMLRATRRSLGWSSQLARGFAAAAAASEVRSGACPLGSS